MHPGALRAVFFVALLAYPVLVWLGLARFGVGALAIILGVLLATRLYFARRGLGAGFPFALAAVAVFVVAVGATGNERLLKAYPVLVSLSLFTACVHTLVHPPSLIERGLRLAGRPPSPAATPYLRWVTIGWSVFFLANAGVATWTAVAAPLGTWALYNGLIAYLVIGALIGLEWLIRPFYKRRVRSGHGD